MITAIQASYRNPVVRVAVNKHLTPAIKFECGVLQGDPLSVLLYIITIQPLLYALNGEGLGIPVTFEGRGAVLRSRAHADDLVLLLGEQRQWEIAEPIIQTYCEVSNAIMHPGKATSIYKNDGGETTTWQESVRMKGKEIKRGGDEYVHMGCPIRPDGQAPRMQLSVLIATLRRAATLKSLAYQPLLTRVEVLNSHILSKMWFTTQLCPIHPEFLKEVETLMKSEVFPNRTRSAIEFALLGYPKQYGGLGLHLPEVMMTAMNGRAAARMIVDKRNVGTAFKLQFLRAIDEQSGSFFRLLAKAPWKNSLQGMPNAGPPFFQRIYETFLKLNMSVSTDWEEYTDAEFLALPWDCRAIYTKGLEKKELPNREAMLRLRVFLLRDILVFQTRGPRRFRVRNDTEAREMLKDRFIQLVPNIDPRTFFAQGQSAGPWRAATSAFSKVRTAWNTVIFPNATAEFKERLQKIQAVPDTLSPMKEGSRNHFIVTSLYDLVPWDKLTLAGNLCKDYKVREGRRELTQARVIIPEWEEIEEREQGAEGKREQVWKEAWWTLNWKYRPREHHEAYWKLLHKRAYKVLSRTTVTKEVREVVDGVEQAVTKTNLKYGTGKCRNCGEKDINQHAFILCPEVRRSWEEGTEILWQLLGWYRGTRNLEISVCEVVLAFPKLREDLPKQAQARVVL